jgi:hypothetical protein
MSVALPSTPSRLTNDIHVTHHNYVQHNIPNITITHTTPTKLSAQHDSAATTLLAHKTASAKKNKSALKSSPSPKSLTAHVTAVYEPPAVTLLRSSESRLAQLQAERENDRNKSYSDLVREQAQAEAKERLSKLTESRASALAAASPFSRSTFSAQKQRHDTELFLTPSHERLARKQHNLANIDAQLHDLAIDQREMNEKFIEQNLPARKSHFLHDFPSEGRPQQLKTEELKQKYQELSESYKPIYRSANNGLISGQRLEPEQLLQPITSNEQQKPQLLQQVQRKETEFLHDQALFEPENASTSALNISASSNSSKHKRKSAGAKKLAVEPADSPNNTKKKSGKTAKNQSVSEQNRARAVADAVIQSGSYPADSPAYFPEYLAELGARNDWNYAAGDQEISRRPINIEPDTVCEELSLRKGQKGKKRAAANKKQHVTLGRTQWKEVKTSQHWESEPEYSGKARLRNRKLENKGEMRRKSAQKHKKAYEDSQNFPKPHNFTNIELGIDRKIKKLREKRTQEGEISPARKIDIELPRVPDYLSEIRRVDHSIDADMYLHSFVRPKIAANLVVSSPNKAYSAYKHHRGISSDVRSQPLYNSTAASHHRNASGIINFENLAGNLAEKQESRANSAQKAKKSTFGIKNPLQADIDVLNAENFAGRALDEAIVSANQGYNQRENQRNQLQSREKRFENELQQLSDAEISQRLEQEVEKLANLGGEERKYGSLGRNHGRTHNSRDIHDSSAQIERDISDSINLLRAKAERNAEIQRLFEPNHAIHEAAEAQAAQRASARHTPKQPNPVDDQSAALSYIRSNYADIVKRVEQIRDE